MVTVRPYDEILTNSMNTANEVFCILVAYMILPIQDFKYDVEQLYDMAYIPLYTLYVCAAMNLIVGLVY